jgi:hypothetical protein
MTFQTFTGREYLKIDIANNYGLDKLTWAERIAWFDRHQMQLDDLVGSAKEPALFFAGVKAWRAVERGEPIGYMISLDATSSGLQLLAALTCDPYAAALCNVVDTGNREDAYQNVFNHMKQIVGSTVQLDPKDVKQAVMTAFYSSKAVPKKVFGEGPLLDVFYGTLQRLAPGAWELNEAMLSLWNPTALEHSWVLPDNFHCHIKVMAPVREKITFLGTPHDVFYNVNAPMPEGRSLGANTIHSIDGMIVRELTRRCDYNKRQIDHLQRLLQEGDFGTSSTTMNDMMVQILWARYQASGYLSARILDYLNEDNLGLVDVTKIQKLLDSLPFRPFKLVSIHDCFRCLPHYGNDLRIQYNLQLKLIAESTILQDLISQLIGQPVTIGKLDPGLPNRITHTNYALS